MPSFSFSLSKSTFLGPFIVVLGGLKYRFAASQIVWVIVATTYFFSERLPNGRLMCMWRYTNCGTVHSLEHNTFFHLARDQWRWRLAKSSLLFFITGFRCGFRAGLSELHFVFFAETSQNSVGTHSCNI